MIRLQFSLREGEFELRVDETIEAQVLALYGPSGAGKTTLLEVIAGWRSPQVGEIAIDGRLFYAASNTATRRVNVPICDRRVGYVPQDGLLWPHLSVRRNVLYGAAAHGPDAPSGLADVAETLEIAHLLERPVTGLSGGERQRVALARALVRSPMLLLLDEPLAAVDAARRERILPYLRRVRDELDVPMIYVTHQAAEVRAIADQVLVLDEGRVTARGSVDLLRSDVR